jgi:predicted DNA-binding WGR domain protein
MLKRELELVSEQAREYCTIVLNGATVMVTDGVVGAGGKKRIKECRPTMFATDQKAKASHEHLVQQKLGEGYADAESVSSASVAAKVEKTARKTERLLLRYGDADVPYGVVSSRFDTPGRRLDICLQLKVSSDDDEWPPEMLIRFSQLDIGAPGSSLHVRDERRN